MARKRQRKTTVPLPVEKPPRWPKLIRVVSKVKSILAAEFLPKKFNSGRRKALATGAAYLAAGAVIGGLGSKLALTRQQLAKQHEIIIALDRHVKTVDIEHARRAIEAAKRLGQPFHAIGLENSEAKKGQLEEFLLTYGKLAKLREAQHEITRSTGLSARESEEKLREEILEDYKNDKKEEYPEWGAGVDFLSFKTGLPLVPIEEYDEKEIEQIRRFTEASARLAATAMITLPSLQAQKNDLEKSARLNAAAIRLRNMRIEQTVPKVAALLKKHHPKMPHKLRILYTLGASHAAGFHSSGADIQLSFGENHHNPIPAITYKLNANPDAKLSELERAQIVLATHLIAKQSHSDQPQAVRERELIVSQLAKTTEEDFAKLNEKSSGKTIDEKEEIIRKYLLKK